MKRIFVFLLAGLMLFLASCADTPESEPLIGPPGDRMTEDEGEQAPIDTAPAETTASWEEPEFQSRVELINGEGEPLDTYWERVWFMRGSLVGDGRLMFQSVEVVLPTIRDRIPVVDLGESPSVRITAVNGESVSGGERVSVYGPGGTLLAKNISWQEVLSCGKIEWSGRTVYLYYSVRFVGPMDSMMMEPQQEIAYFVGATFK